METAVSQADATTQPEVPSAASVADSELLLLPSIRALPQAVINRIAAGEVIHRPCTALKELLENAVDAGSTSIAVVVSEGGLKLLSIQDNGNGIARDDMKLLCQRFHTSKLRAYEDLSSMQTYGFRGEALASMSFVARVKVMSQRVNTNAAFMCEYENGKATRDVQRAAFNVSSSSNSNNSGGTLIQVHDMFLHDFTRRSSFAHVNVEFIRCLDLVQKYAMHHSGISISCKKTGTGSSSSSNNSSSNSVHTALNASTLDNIRAIYGAATARELLPIAFSSDSDRLSHLTATGYISNANFSLPKLHCTIFVNHRLVESAALRRCIEAVTASFLPRHSHPFIYIALTVAPADVDVNVHPTKNEVQLLCEAEIVEAISGHLQQLFEKNNSSRTFYTQATISNNNSSNKSGSFDINTSTAAIKQPLTKLQVLSHTNSLLIPHTVIGNNSFSDNNNNNADSQLQLQDSNEDIAGGGSCSDDDDQPRGVFESPQRNSKAANNSSSNIDTPFLQDDDGSPVGVRLRFDQQNTYRHTQTEFGANAAATTKPQQHQQSQQQHKLPSQQQQQQSQQQKQRVRDNQLVRTDASQVRGSMDNFITMTKRQKMDDHSSSNNNNNNNNSAADDECELLSFSERQPQFDLSSAEHEQDSNSSSSMPQHRQPITSQQSAAATAAAAATPPAVRRPVLLTSVLSMRNQLHNSCHQHLQQLFSGHVFVGFVSHEHAVIQHHTRLYLINTTTVAREFCYQQLLFGFGQQDTIKLTTPVSVKQLLLMYIRHKNNKVSNNNNNSHSSSSSDAAADEAKKLTALLAGKAAMLDEYFGIGITAASSDGDSSTISPVLLTHLPQLLHRSYTPPLAVLPLFLFSLAQHTNWSDEALCFEGVAQHLASFFTIQQPSLYIHKKVMTGITTAAADSSSNSASDGNDAAAGEQLKQQTAYLQQIVQHVLFPLLKQQSQPQSQQQQQQQQACFLPSKQLAATNSIIQIACLKQLYKIFERC